jgi:hypothetical protein
VYLDVGESYAYILVNVELVKLISVPLCEKETLGDPLKAISSTKEKLDCSNL